MANFKVSARTVDMLGRQQIAGIPTAISELFKNAHDAYADTVEVDYFRDDGLFILRDDGLGMTREDFEQRWLTLGTDSKVQGSKLAPPATDKNKKRRPVLGEKGIGRLAIALIGSQVLILTRAKRDGIPTHVTVAAYIHWGIFELPGLDLSEIFIPIVEFSGGKLPDANDVSKIVTSSKESLKRIFKEKIPHAVQKIIQEMDKFQVDPKSYDEFLGTPSLSGDGCGTHFYIFPTNSIIENDIDDRDDSQGIKKATRFESSLIGFTNTMTPGHPKPAIKTTIRDHRDEGEPVELISDKIFFTPDEFEGVDHHILGSFDKYGQFKGTVGIYQTNPEPYVLNWAEGNGEQTECGPFDLSFAYLQGDLRNSLVPPDEHARLKNKLNIHGGIYVYRDGIRVQPYGNSDHDYLDIERRRTKGAGYYFYSYRRMFGTIELTSDKNKNLSEKAGREGFSENKAYRQMRSILMNFFVQSAGDFFRESGQFSKDFVENRTELERLHEIRRISEKKRRVRKAAFQSNLDAFFEKHNNELLATELSDIVFETEIKLASIVKRKVNDQQKALAFLRAEKEQRSKLSAIRQRLTIAMPRGLVANSIVRNEWQNYLEEFAAIEEKILSPCEVKIEELISSIVSSARIPLQAVTRLEENIKLEGRNSNNAIKEISAKTEETLSEISSNIRKSTKKSFGEINAVTNAIFEELALIQRSKMSDKEFSLERRKLEKRLTATFEEEKESLLKLKDQLSTVSEIWMENGFTSSELAEALEYEVEELRSENEINLELAQIGMALNTINHEFEKTVGALRTGFSRLNEWAKGNPELLDLYESMRVNFDHLDGYLAMFTPLDRRLNREKIDISGKDIADFLEDLFEARFDRHDISLKSSKRFDNAVVFGFPSSFYPVFVNLVDNAIFWLDSVKDQPKIIKMDFVEGGFTIANNGPDINPRDRENIFELNFTRKPGGRGMGLYISRQTLAKVGYALNLVSTKNDKNTGAKFVIAPIDPIS